MHVPHVTHVIPTAFLLALCQTLTLTSATLTRRGEGTAETEGWGEEEEGLGRFSLTATTMELPPLDWTLSAVQDKGLTATPGPAPRPPGRPAAELCDSARLRCTVRTGCQMALNNFLHGCRSLLTAREDREQCTRPCQHALVSLLATEDGAGLSFLHCRCGAGPGRALCEERKRRVAVCQPGVLRSMHRLRDRGAVLGCRFARRVCEADTSCLAALRYYVRHCAQLFTGTRCTARCRNSVRILYRQPGAGKLRTCRCEGDEDYDCPSVVANTEKLCLQPPHQDHHQHQHLHHDSHHHDHDFDDHRDQHSHHHDHDLDDHQDQHSQHRHDRNHDHEHDHLHDHDHHHAGHGGFRQPGRRAGNPSVSSSLSSGHSALAASAGFPLNHRPSSSKRRKRRYKPRKKSRKNPPRKSVSDTKPSTRQETRKITNRPFPPPLPPPPPPPSPSKQKTGNDRSCRRGRRGQGRRRRRRRRTDKKERVRRKAKRKNKKKKKCVVRSKKARRALPTT